MSKVVTSIGVLSVAALTLLAAVPAQAADDQDQVAALKARVARMEAQLASMSQTANEKKADPNWFNKIHVSGGLDVDGKFGSLGSSTSDSGLNVHNVGRFTGQSARQLAVTDSYVDADADINDWSSARVGIVYSGASSHYLVGKTITGSPKRTFDVDQAYITLANFNEYPYYARVGRQYIPFGQYTLYPITRTATQVLSEIDLAAVNVGFVGVNGFSAAAYGFQNPISQAQTNSVTSSANGRRSLNGGFMVGYSKPSQSFGYYAKGGYLYNMTALDAFQRDGVATGAGASNTTHLYWKRVGAVALNLGLNSGPFDASVDYVTALSSFSGVFYQYNTAGSGAKPSAYNVQGGYGFQFFNDRDNHVTLGYGHTKQASFVGLPQSMWSVGYSLALLKNLTLGAEFDRDTDYSSSYVTPDGTGTGTHYNVVTIRLGVNF